jgi:hypothetical protein
MASAAFSGKTRRGQQPEVGHRQPAHNSGYGAAVMSSPARPVTTPSVLAGGTIECADGDGGLAEDFVSDAGLAVVPGRTGLPQRVPSSRRQAIGRRGGRTGHVRTSWLSCIVGPGSRACPRAVCAGISSSARRCNAAMPVHVTANNRVSGLAAAGRRSEAPIISIMLSRGFLALRSQLLQPKCPVSPNLVCVSLKLAQFDVLSD